MNVLSATAVSGMRAFRALSEASANNIANALTPGYRRQVVSFSERQGGGVEAEIGREPESAPSANNDGAPEALGMDTVGGDLASDLVDQRIALHGYSLMAGLIRTEEELLGTLLDTFA